jgi:rubrerythrin
LKNWQTLFYQQAEKQKNYKLKNKTMPIQVLSCVKCKHEWASKKESKKCPKCQTKLFDGSKDKRFK